MSRAGVSNRSIAAVLAASAAVLALASCASTSTSGNSGGASGAVTTLSMGIEPWIGYAPWYIAQEKGFFAKHGLSVNIVNFQTDGDRNAALIAGQTQVSNIDAGRVVQFSASSQPGVPLFLEDASLGADAILSDPSISTAQQLVGKTVSYEYGTTSDLLLHYYLLQNKISASQVISNNVPAASAGTLLIAGKSPAVVTYQPYISEATSGANGTKAHVLFGSDKAPGLISDFLVGNKDWLASHGDVVKELLAAWDDSVNYYATNRTDAVAIMAKGVGADAASLGSTLAGVKIYSAADNKQMLADGSLAAEIKMISDTFVSMGTIKQPVELTALGNFAALK
jgi:NitT/TauT family transport system substrate-binding protein